MNVAELIQWLQTQDQTAIVQVINHDRDGGNSYYCQGGTARIEDFHAEGEHVQYGWGDLYEYAAQGKDRLPTLLLGRSE